MSCRSSSSVFSQQFDKTGNILFRGFPNGVISTIDLRNPAPKESVLHHSADSAVNGVNSGYQHNSKGINPNVKKQHFGVVHANGRQSNRHRIDDYFCSHSKVMRMDSAICRFVLLGTAGIGKSVFTLFWICFWATLGEKVVWKTSKDAWYLLDFSKERPASARRLEESAHELQLVLDDREAWLIIDGGHCGPLTYACHILVACFLKNENYKEFSKNQQVSLQYVPAWSEEEMNKFLDDFEALRGSYSHMLVPKKDEAMESFEKLGGVPRYVLHSGKTAEAVSRMDMAVNYLDKASCLKYFTGTFEDAKMSDSLVHIKCEDESYKSWFYVFASPYVQDKFGKRFTAVRLM